MLYSCTHVAPLGVKGLTGSLSAFCSRYNTEEVSDCGGYKNTDREPDRDKPSFVIFDIRAL